MKITAIGLDLAKSVFQAHGVDQSGRTALVKKLHGKQMRPFFSNLPPCLIDVEACATAHHWARTLSAMGHEVKPGAPAMPGLAMLACVEATRDGGPASTRYDLSYARLSPRAFAGAVRSHWAIENSLHWALDVTFGEDAARNRADSGPENLAILRRLTLNLLRTARPNLGVSRKRKRSGRSDDFARTIIGQMRWP